MERYTRLEQSFAAVASAEKKAKTRKKRQKRAKQVKKKVKKVQNKGKDVSYEPVRTIVSTEYKVVRISLGYRGGGHKKEAWPVSLYA